LAATLQRERDAGEWPETSVATWTGKESNTAQRRDRMSQKSGPRPAALAYTPELDGLRAMSLLIVIALHTVGNITPGGYIGVDVFFVLSGFLITRILLAEFEETGGISFMNFYARRCLRLMPALWLFLSIWVVLAVLHGGANERNHLWAALSAVTYFMNWVRAFRLGPMDMLGHTWSLGVEEQFYLLWPPVLLLILTRFNRSSVWVLPLILLTASFAWRVFLIHAGADEERVYNGFDTRAETLLYGCLLAVLPTGRLGALAPLARRFWFVPVFGLAVCVFFLPGYSNDNPGKWWKIAFTVGLSGVAVCAAWVIALVSDWRAGTLRIPVLSWKPAVYMGRISYGIYLWHFPISVVLKPHLAGPLNLLVTSAGATGIAAASFHLIEARALRLKQRFNRHGARVALAVDRGVKTQLEGSIRAARAT
jgi:peptidoglycan/LPS O-acetylase OafA/YrhL